MKIDFEGIEDRLLSFPVDEGKYRQIVASKGRALYTKFPVRGLHSRDRRKELASQKGSLMEYKFETQKESTIVNDVHEIAMARDNRTIAYRSGRKIRVFDSKKKPKKGIRLVILYPTTIMFCLGFVFRFSRFS